MELCCAYCFETNLERAVQIVEMPSHQHITLCYACIEAPQTGPEPKLTVSWVVDDMMGREYE